MKSILLRGGVAAALIGAAMSAQASTLTLSLSGFATGSVVTSVSSPNPGRPVDAGALQGTLSGNTGFDADPFITYCVELTQNFAWGNPLAGYSIAEGGNYFATHAAGASNIVTRLGRLFTALGGISDPTTTTDSAAIQLAVWESVYETSVGPLSVSAGSFAAAETPQTAAAIARANQLLASASLLTQSIYSISVLQNAISQDFVLVRSNQVPEPATLGLVAVALAAGVGAARRKKA